MTDVAFNFDAHNSLTGTLGFQLFSALPTASAASGLKAAAAASARAQRTKRAQTIDTSGLEAQARIAQRTANNYQRLSHKLDQTVDAVTDARDTLLGLKKTLAEMRRLIVLSQGTTITEEERRQHADTFDQLHGKLNIKVSISGGITGNLIGSAIRDIFTPEEIVYRTRPDSQATQSVTGVYSGSDYTITDGSGNLYFVDRYGSLLQQFPFDDAVEGEIIKSTDTISFDSSTGAISLTHSGDASPYVSGALERKGLGLLHSFLYGDFTDPAKLDEALTDLDAASAKLRFNISVIEGQLAKATAHRDFNEKFVKEHQDLAIKIQTGKSVEQQKAALETQRQQLLYQRAFQGTVSFDGRGTLLSLGLESLFDFKI